MKKIFLVESDNPSNVDVAVLLLFFVREEQTRQTFEQIKKARPARLYLYQDGPRSQKDIHGIEACRKIVSNIDWNCEVHQFYQENNFGCDPSEYISQKWMFETETKGIIIEDDDVMSVSFFRFCKELLDKYENDTRVGMICGMNHLEVYEDCPDDYFFSTAGTIWGWATWKRVVDSWDSQYTLMDDPYVMNLLELNSRSPKIFNNFKKLCKAHKATGKEHYESILSWSKKLNSQYAIFPKYNMTCNIGIAKESTHSVSDITRLPRKTRRVMYMKTYEYDFPLKHPKYLMPERNFEKKFCDILFGTPLERFFHTRKIESILYKVFPMLGK